VSDAMNTLKQNRSIFNPTDMAMMKQEGEISANMTVREYFAKLGVDVEGPITQLVDLAKDQMQKGDPLNKMKAIAGSPAGGPPMGGPPRGQLPQAPGGGVAPPTPGMSGLLKNM